MSKKLKVKKRLPYYIVQQIDLASNSSWYRVHDIYYNYCWACATSIEVAIDCLVRKCIECPDVQDVFNILFELSDRPGMLRYRHREQWLDKFAKKAKDNKEPDKEVKIPWDYYQEYEALLDNSGEYKTKIQVFKLYPEEYLRESLEEHKLNMHRVNKWVKSKIKDQLIKERKIKRIRDLLLPTKFSNIKSSPKVADKHTSDKVSKFIKKFNRR